MSRKPTLNKEEKQVRLWFELNILYERLLLVFLILILLVVSWCMYDNIYVYTHVLDESIKQYKPGRTGTESIQIENTPISDDMVGWLTIDGTNIDYPVMQTSDNIKYLNTDPFGKYSLSGSIYLDYRCSGDFSDSYSLIYGHHMEYGRMFGALDDFLDRDYLLGHTYGTLIIGRDASETYELEVFASTTVSAREDTVFNIRQDEIRSRIPEIARIYTHNGTERILGISTCAEADSLTRIIIFCYIKDRV